MVRRKSASMDKVKIKRVKRPKKPITAKQKVLAGLGVGGAFVGLTGAGGVNSKSVSPPPVVATEKNSQKSLGGKIKDKLAELFGPIKRAKADDEEDGWDDGWSYSGGEADMSQVDNTQTNISALNSGGGIFENSPPPTYIDAPTDNPNLFEPPEINNPGIPVTEIPDLPSYLNPANQMPTYSDADNPYIIDPTNTVSENRVLVDPVAVTPQEFYNQSQQPPVANPAQPPAQAAEPDPGLFEPPSLINPTGSVQDIPQPPGYLQSLNQEPPALGNTSSDPQDKNIFLQSNDPFSNQPWQEPGQPSEPAVKTVQPGVYDPAADIIYENPNNGTWQTADGKWHNRLVTSGSNTFNNETDAINADTSGGIPKVFSSSEIAYENPNKGTWQTEDGRWHNVNVTSGNNNFESESEAVSAFNAPAQIQPITSMGVTNPADVIYENTTYGVWQTADGKWHNRLVTSGDNSFTTEDAAKNADTSGGIPKVLSSSEIAYENPNLGIWQTEDGKWHNVNVTSGNNTYDTEQDAVSAFIALPVSLVNSQIYPQTSRAPMAHDLNIAEKTTQAGKIMEQVKQAGEKIENIAVIAAPQYGLLLKAALYFSPSQQQKIDNWRNNPNIPDSQMFNYEFLDPVTGQTQSLNISKGQLNSAIKEIQSSVDNVYGAQDKNGAGFLKSLGGIIPGVGKKP